MAELLQFPGATRLAVDDAPARAAALDIRSSCIVEAPAGSGKTGLLVQRYLKLLGDSELEAPEEVLAITFTRKATAELQERVLQQLQSARAGTALDEDASIFQRETRRFAEAALHRDWRLLDQPQRLNIRSIDSVCAGIADALPLLSGSGGPQRPVEDANALYRQAARRTLLQLGGSRRELHHALHELLLHRDGNLGDYETLLAEMLATREQWGELLPLGPGELDDHTLDREVRPRLEATLERIVCGSLTRLLHTIPAHLLQELTQLAALLAHEPGYDGGPSPLSICANRTETPTEKAEHLDHWLALISLLLTKDGWRKPRGVTARNLGFLLPDAHKPRLLALIDAIQNDPLLPLLQGIRELPPAAYPDDQWRIARSLFRVLSHALVELKLLFAERGECDFSELALNARLALQREFEAAPIGEGSATGAALTSGSRLRHLLVDEMQDTSSAQYALLELLTRTWDGHSQTLFLVGDPKQSIYLFRQARVERFLRMMLDGRLGDIPLAPLRLTANFRSQATLVARFNETFECIFPTAENAGTGDVPFVPADPRRDPSPGSALHWHTAVVGEQVFDPGLRITHDAGYDYKLQEARDVCRAIADFLKRPLPADRKRGDHGEPEPWKVAVLVRGRNHLSEIVAELNRTGLPFRAVDIDALSERPEVLDALSLTRALLHPADRTAWLAVLRAPWCGLGLGDLLTLTGEGPDADPIATVAALVAARRSLLSADAQRLLARAWPVLETAVATRGRTSLALHVERTWRSLGGDAWLTPEQQTNVLRYLDLLHNTEAEGEGRVHLDLLAVRLGKLFGEPRAGKPQIELLTIHKAKGLEWDLVLVPGLHRPPANSRGVLLDWLELDDDRAATLLLAPIQPRGEEVDPLNAWLRRIRAQRERAEEKRLVYVAATRAREELHLFAAAKRTKSGSLAAPQYNSLLKACWPAAEPHFAASARPHFATPPGSAAPGSAAPGSAAPGSAAPGSAADDARPPIQPWVQDDYEPLALAASAAEPTIQRLPLGFDPALRFTRLPRLDYPAAASLRRAAAFERPEGGFGARAFGNVVHRYLQLLAERLAANIAAATLLAELPGWAARLSASLRGEGLAPSAARRESERALDALTRTLHDATGRWILVPHAAATSEQALSTPAGSLRADRTFLAGAAPGSVGDTHIWIVDFKTSEQGSRSDDAFAAVETSKYGAQLEAYARLRRTVPGGHLPIHLGLYYPLLPKLIHWPSDTTQ